jgi:hypothetical protein
MALSLLFPEIMMLCSFGQWRKARRLHAMWIERFPVTKECPDSLGMQGAFFVLAGGFLVKEGKDYKTVLTPLGFEHYVRSGRIDPQSFDRRQITDKGKASSMAKALVLCQATWFLYQCIRRGSAGLPITILEVHIITQVLFMFVLYYFWWQKPLSVAEPLPIILYPRQGDQASLGSNEPRAIAMGPPDSPHDTSALVPEGPPIEEAPEFEESRQYNMFSRSYQMTERARSGLPNLLLKVVYDVSEYIVIRDKSHGWLYKGKYSEKGKGRAAASGGVMGGQEAGRDGGREGEGGYAGERGGEGAGQRESEGAGERAAGGEARAGTPGNNGGEYAEGVDDDNLHKSARDMFIIGIMLASNGAMHIPAWPIHFPTETEAWLWRAACIAIVVTSVIFTCMVAATNYDKRFLRAMWETRFYDQSVLRMMFLRIHAGRGDITRNWQQKKLAQNHGPMKRMMSWPLYWLERILFEIFWILIFVYLLCTVFLLVEAFISMRDVPRKTYVTTRDTDGGYWPHFV